MAKFDELIKKHETYLITEQPGEGEMEPDQGMDGMEAPDQQQQQQQPAPMPPKVFDKPYQDLGQILYKALRMNFGDIPETIQDQIHVIAPDGSDSIDSDEKGSALFGAVESILSEQEMVPSHEGQ